jgi:hypothetical protein
MLERYKMHDHFKVARLKYLSGRVYWQAEMQSVFLELVLDREL